MTVLICSSLMTFAVEHLFIGSIAISISSRLYSSDSQGRLSFLFQAGLLVFQAELHSILTRNLKRVNQGNVLSVRVTH